MSGVLACRQRPPWWSSSSPAAGSASDHWRFKLLLFFNWSSCGWIFTQPETSGRSEQLQLCLDTLYQPASYLPAAQTVQTGGGMWNHLDHTVLVLEQNRWPAFCHDSRVQVSQNCLYSRIIYRSSLPHSLLLCCSVHSLFVRATHVLGHLNLGPDLLSLWGPLGREWRLHSSAQIRDCLTEVDLFAFEANTHCPLSSSVTDPLGMDVLHIHGPTHFWMYFHQWKWYCAAARPIWFHIILITLHSSKKCIKLEHLE